MPAPCPLAGEWAAKKLDKIPDRQHQLLEWLARRANGSEDGYTCENMTPHDIWRIEWDTGIRTPHLEVLLEALEEANLLHRHDTTWVLDPRKHCTQHRKATP